MSLERLEEVASSWRVVIQIFEPKSLVVCFLCDEVIGRVIMQVLGGRQ